MPDNEDIPSLRFSASYASQLNACPGSAHLHLSIPGWTPPEVDDMKGARGKGTTIHDYLRITTELPVSDVLKIIESMQYVAEIRSRRRFKVLAEETVEAEWLVTKPKTTVDLVLYVQDEIHIIDYKTGKIPVRAQGNSQLMYYALCHAWRAPKAKSVHLHIVQPWSPDGSSHYEVSAKELAEYMELCQETEQKILAKDTTLTPSDNCLFCPAYPHSRGDKGRPFCPPALQLLYPPVVDEDAILALLDE